MITAYFLCKARQGKLKIAANSLREHEELEDVNETLGNYDIICKGVFEDMDDLKTFIQNKLQITDGIKDTETLMVIG
ncbi:Lrp/AsnC family transcriptional regulator [Candidatus Woesearchaeota archaeon]|nr:Lrp/AsnC family transcriptional regulator [Candidatus Woesearchaeota archaeon]